MGRTEGTMKLKQRLMLLHFETGLTIAQDAVKSSVPTRTFTDILYGRTVMPKGDTLEKLARHYDVSADYLLGFSDNRRRFGE